jgi:hypothetical protein
MGGLGSGGHNSSGRPTTAEVRAIDANAFRRAGVLQPGYRGGWQWAYADGTRAWIGLAMRHEALLVLSYRFRRGGGDAPWQEVEQPTAILWRPCRFGGERPCFACPGCGRAAMKLCGAGPRFLCRRCSGLTYASQRERWYDRALRRAHRLRVRLGGEPGMASPFPSRPKGMHRCTYERLVDEIIKAEAVADERTVELVRRFAERGGAAERSRGGTLRKGFWT